MSSRAASESVRREDVCEVAAPKPKITREIWRKALWFWFLLLAVLLVLNAILSNTVLSKLNNQHDQTVATANLRLDMIEYLSALKDMETGQRGYLLVGEESYLKPYEEGKASLERLTGKIRMGLAPESRPFKNFNKIAQTTKLKLSEMAENIQIYITEGKNAARKEVSNNRGQELMDQIRGEVSALIVDQQNDLKILNHEASRLKWWSHVLTLVTSIAGIIFLGILYVYVQRTLEQRAALLKAQQIAAENVSRALEDKEKAFNDLTRVNKVKDEFLAIVSHELRTPLNAILGWATLLKEGAAPEEYEEGMQSIDRNARAQSLLIEDMLDVSRIVSGKIRLQVLPVDLRVVAREAVESSRPALSAKQLELEVEMSEDSPMVSGDANRLQQVVWNLLSNAIKFTHKGGHIRLSVQRIASSMVLIVKDDGIGFQPDFQLKMFERFAQADTSTTREQGGLGLGLAIVRHIVELHGGSVHAHSDGLDKGASFQVDLPVMGISGEPMLPPRESATGIVEMPGAKKLANGVKCTLPDLKGIRIFLVDDQPDTVRVLSSVLIRCGAKVFTANTGQEALNGVVDARAQILVSDIGLPDMDGYTLIGKVRQMEDPVLQAIPTLALTAFARSEDRVKALEAGFNDHLAKPADAMEFARRVGRLASQIA